MKGKMKKLILFPILALLVTGCASVPMTKITMPSPRGAFSMEFPKDMSWTNVTFDVSPDGTVHAKIGSVTSHNDATVLGVIAGANAAMLHDTLGFAEGVIAKGAKGATGVP